MTQDEIIEMAREARLPNSDLYHENLKTFANLVAAKEREACAVECDQMIEAGATIAWLPVAIRARGEQA